jgi:hypothetical protein
MDGVMYVDDLPLLASALLFNGKELNLAEETIFQGGHILSSAQSKEPQQMMNRLPERAAGMHCVLLLSALAVRSSGLQPHSEGAVWLGLQCA